MWSTTANRVSGRDIAKEHLRILQAAVAESADWDVCRAEVYEALDYLEQQCSRSWGFTVFRQGLEDKSELALREGFALIRKHLGMEERAERSGSDA